LNRFLSIPAAMLAAALAVTTGASAQVTSLPLPAPPAAGNAAASSIFDAMLAIARAAGSNPAAAQQATFSYNAAIQQYNAGDLARSRMSALQAISATSTIPAAQATAMPPPPIPQPNYVPMPNVLSANQADAEAWVALARRSLSLCGAPRATAPDAAMQQYTASVADLTTQKLAAAKAASQAVIDQCATASDAYAKQMLAQPAPSMTPAAMGAYSPLPIATLGPDPALAQTPSPVVMPSTTPEPAARRGFRL
jgi:hypothetical protein